MLAVNKLLVAAAFTLPTVLLAQGSADATKSFAEVEIKLDDAKLAEKAAGIRVLYLTLYDAGSQASMPYGAMKVSLEKDAKKGVVYTGKLDSSNVMVMGGGGVPAKLRIKARLDKDGSAGKDAAGDLVGIADGVVLGSKAVITIDKAM